MLIEGRGGGHSRDSQVGAVIVEQGSLGELQKAVWASAEPERWGALK